MKDHWVLVGWFFATALVNLLMRTRTAEEWDALAQKNSRYASVARLLRSVGVDPVKLIQSLVDFVRGESQKRLAESLDGKEESAESSEAKPEPEKAADAEDSASDSTSEDPAVEKKAKKKAKAKKSAKKVSEIDKGKD